MKPQGSKERHRVILLHGLGRSAKSMTPLQKSLSEAGYEVYNVGYVSTEHSIEDLAETVLGTFIRMLEDADGSKIHFVTHSMGGIMVRQYLKAHRLPILGRVVMISPPNQGTELVDRFKGIFLFKGYGPAGKQLSSQEDSLPNTLGPVDFELGVIAGNRTLNPVYSLMLPGPDDGVIPVERTKVTGMTDFIIMPHTHPFIMKKADVIDQVLYFLENGEFDHKTPIKGPSRSG
ncbi:esterase/lipase family protein [Acidobacteriota bacterium]